MTAPPDDFARAIALRRAGRYVEALTAYRAAHRSDPGDWRVMSHLGMTLSLLGRREEAEPLLRRALTLEPTAPDIQHALCLTLLAQGRFREAAPLYHMRHGVPGSGAKPLPVLDVPRWEGQPLAGRRIALFPEGGFGDQIQWARFVPVLQAQGAEVILLTEPGLARLFAVSFPGATVIPASGRVNFPDPDYWAVMGDLWVALGVAVDDLDGPPYLRLPNLPPAPRADGFRIGLKMLGNARFRHDRTRSLPEAEAAGLRARLPGEIVGLEPGETGARDFLDTAVLLRSLDLVVTVDTAVAHLAGALGRPCLVLVPGIATDWRWLHGRDSSPWYASLRLFRGNAQGDWQPAIARLVEHARRIARETTMSATR